MQLADRNVLVTGGSKGIGKAIAREVLSRGANAILLARGAEALEEARAELAEAFPERSIWTVTADVSDYAAVERAIGNAVSQANSIGGVVNNAGIAMPRYFDEISVDEFEHVMKVDYLGSVYVTKAVVPHLSAGSFVAFTSSVAGYIGAFGYASYSPAKFAQIGFAEVLDQELMARGIRVCVLCPPDTETPGLEEENKIKPFETAEMAKTASLMKADAVAKKFVDGLVRGTFLINCNIESRVLYRLKGAAPGIARSILRNMVRKAQAKKPVG